MIDQEPTGTMWVCVYCMVLLCNGEISPDCERPDALLSRFAEPVGMHVTPGMLRREHACVPDDADDNVEPDEECDCETNTYSTSQCEGCGSYLHGERHAVTGWTQVAA